MQGQCIDLPPDSAPWLYEKVVAFRSKLQLSPSVKRCIFVYADELTNCQIWTVVVAQLVELSLPNSRGPRFESSRQQKFISNINCQLFQKDENKEKETGNGPFLNCQRLLGWEGRWSSACVSLTIGVWIPPKPTIFFCKSCLKGWN